MSEDRVFSECARELVEVIARWNELTPGQQQIIERMLERGKKDPDGAIAWLAPVAGIVLETSAAAVVSAEEESVDEAAPHPVLNGPHFLHRRFRDRP